MPEHQRCRRILQRLTAALPAVWTAPVVMSVVLPAHAQTSGESSESDTCTAPAGCYDFATSGSFNWPGGNGPTQVDIFVGSGCSGGSSDPGTFVVARDADEASATETVASPWHSQNRSSSGTTRARWFRTARWPSLISCGTRGERPLHDPRPPREGVAHRCLYQKTANSGTMKRRLGMGRRRPIVGRAEAGMPEPEPTRTYLPAYRR